MYGFTNCIAIPISEEKMANSYQSVFSVVARVKVPGATVLHLVPAKDVPDGNGGLLNVAAHYHNGLPCGNKQFLNRHFYGIEPGEDAGRTIVAEVKVVKKVVGERSFVMLDVTKVDPQVEKPTGTLKFHQNPGDGFKVISKEGEVMNIQFATLLRLVEN